MNLLIYGSASYARTLRELVCKLGHTFVGYIDDFNRGDEIIGDYATVKRTYSANKCEMVMGIGYKYFEQRWNIYQKITDDGYRTPPVVHPTAYVADARALSSGCVVMAGAIIDVRAALGELSVVWPGACVNHDAKIGPNTFVSPNATICGCAEVGASVFIGAGSVIADHVTVGDNVFVAAGEVVGERTRQRPRKVL